MRELCLCEVRANHDRVWDRIFELLADPVVAAKEADLVLVLQHHDAFDFSAITDAAVAVFDTRGQLTGDSVERL